MREIPSYLKEFFFSYSEMFDQEYVQGTSTYQDLSKYCTSDKERLFLLLDALELNQTIVKKDIMLTLFSLCAKFTDGKLVENPAFIQVLFENDGLAIIDNALKESIDKLILFHQTKKQDNSDANDMIDMEIQLKATLNTFFLIIMHAHTANIKALLSYFEDLTEKKKQNYLIQNPPTEMISNIFNEQIMCICIDKQFEEYLMKITQLSIELFLVPIKKVICVFFVYLFLELSDSNEKGSKFEEILFTEDAMNQIEKGMARLYIDQPSNTEKFYQRYIINSTDSPLAQVIVVGLLRTMLTTCATNNKYTPTNKGIDLNREWESSVIHIQQYSEEIKIEKEQQKKYLNDYEAYIQMGKEFPEANSGEESNPNGESVEDSQQNIAESCIRIEIDRHRVFTANIIASFILLLAKKLKFNCVWQFSHLIQLITDANGVLVFLKFLTDKFRFISIVIPFIISDQVSQSQLAGDTVYKILKLMFITCNNFPEKISQYLIEYQAFFILRKLPQQFVKREVSKYCYKLLKLQIPLFDKRMLKKNPNFMKVISDLFCKVYGNYEPDQFGKTASRPKQRGVLFDSTNNEEPLRNLYLLEGIRDKKSLLKEFCSQEEVRKINMDFNNYHYWKADEMKQAIRAQLKLDPEENQVQHNNLQEQNSSQQIIGRADAIAQRGSQQKHEIFQQMWESVELPPEFTANYQIWLEDNIWAYYD